MIYIDISKYLPCFIKQISILWNIFLLWKSQMLKSDQLLHNQTNYYQEGSVKFIVTIIITSSVSLLMITPSSNMESRTTPQWTPLCNVYRWLNSGHCSLSYPQFNLIIKCTESQKTGLACIWVISTKKFNVGSFMTPAL